MAQPKLAPMAPALADARRVKCPRCATIIPVPAGQRPVCGNCGFGA